jgi:hypothetical protein
LSLAEKLNKPLVVVLANKNLRLSPNSFGRTPGLPLFYFTLQHVVHSYSTASVENIKRMVYVIELLYKEHVLTKKVEKLVKNC